MASFLFTFISMVQKSIYVSNFISYAHVTLIKFGKLVNKMQNCIKNISNLCFSSSKACGIICSTNVSKLKPYTHEFKMYTIVFISLPLYSYHSCSCAAYVSPVQYAFWVSLAPTVERQGETALVDPSELVKCQNTRNLSSHPCFVDDALANTSTEFQKPSWKTCMLNSEKVSCVSRNMGLDNIKIHCYATIMCTYNMDCGRQSILVCTRLYFFEHNLQSKKRYIWFWFHFILTCIENNLFNKQM